MITEGSKFEFQRIPVADIRVTEYQERYPDRLSHYINLMLANPNDSPGFILVKRMRDCASTYEVLDGHHRFVSHIMTGRSTALCIVIEEPNEPRTEDQGSEQGLRTVVAEALGVDERRASLSDLRTKVELRRAVAQQLLDTWAPTGYIPGGHRTEIKNKWPKLFDALLAFEQEYL